VLLDNQLRVLYREALLLEHVHPFWFAIAAVVARIAQSFKGIHVSRGFFHFRQSQVLHEQQTTCAQYAGSFLHEAPATREVVRRNAASHQIKASSLEREILRVGGLKACVPYPLASDV
jgi:hypothetical protein